MRFITQREALLTPLQYLVSVVERRQTMPILGNVLLQVEQDYLTLTATDLEVELTWQVALEQVIEEGLVTVPARKLFDITRALSEQSALELAFADKKVTVQSGRSRFSLQTLPADEFPQIQCDKASVEVAVAQNQLRYLIEHVHFSMAQQDVRFYLNGMLLELAANHLRTVATDGHRLAMATVNHSGGETVSQCIIPRKGILEILRLVNDSDDSVNLSFADNFIRVTGDNFVLTSKLIDSKYPNYQTVLPKGGSRTLMVSREELKRVLMRISILSNEKYHGIKLSLKPGILTVQAKNTEQEEAVDEIAIDYQHEAFDIGFNVLYFLDILNTLSVEQVKMTFADENSSVLVENPENEQCLYVVMPMRL